MMKPMRYSNTRRSGSTGRTALAALLCSALLQPAVAQDTGERLQIGVIGAGALNMHKGDFSTYDGILECGTFDEATTLGWQAGNIVDVPFSGVAALSLRLYYHKANGDFTTPNPESPFVTLDDGTIVRLQTEHTLATALDYVSLDVLGKWRVLGPVYLGAGPTVALSTRAAYEQEETIVGPRGMTFLNGQTTRNIIAGNFDEQGTQNTERALRLAATGVIGADIALSPSFVLNPEAGYTVGFTNVLSDVEWKVNVLRAGVSLKYVFPDDAVPLPPQTPEPPVADPPPPAKPRPVAALDVQNRLADGTRQNYAEITLTEERSLDVVPLLPYVFFASNSSELQARYRRLEPAATQAFDESTLQDSTLGIYHHVLNIIGSRMRRHPEATITVTGCREPLDDTGTQPSLATDRAQVVKEYLVQAWNIAPSRIHTEARVLPQAVSNRQIGDGREENRRAEIASSDVRILAPVRRESVERRVEPAALVLVPRVQFGEHVQQWTTSLNDAEAEVLWQDNGSGAPSQDIVWNVDDRAVADRMRLSQMSTSLTAMLGIYDDDGQTTYASREIPVRRIYHGRRFNGEIVRDSVLERYGLMFFDFDTPNISDFNTQVMELVQSRMRTNSAVRVTGLTDRIGPEEYNRSLSQQRASAIAQGIRTRIVPAVLSTTGAGEYLIYNNDLPEGRFYNRTVIVEIATPVQE